MHGIDISRWQGDFNFKSRPEAEFVIIKCGGGDDGIYKDSKFERNYTEAKKAGLKVGAYWFANFKNKARAIEEANAFVQRLQGKTFEFPVFLDVEGSMLSVKRTELTEACIAFLEVLDKAGFYVGIYGSESTWWYNVYLNDVVKKFEHIAVWTANYSAQPHTEPCDIWQRAETPIDLDESQIDFEPIIRNAHKNGLKPVEVKPAPAPVAAPKEVFKLTALKKGVKHQDVAIFETIMRKMGLYNGEIDNSFGSGCDAAVRAFQKKYPECGTNGKPDGSCGPKTWNKMFEVMKQ